MAILKYTNANGEVVKVNSYKVNNLIPKQTKGDDPNAVMSQKAVSDEVNEIGLQINEVTGQITAINTALGTKANQSALDALTQTVNGKANASEVYTKTEADGKYLTASDITGKANADTVYTKDEVDAKVTAANTAINSKLPIESFNEWSEGVAMQSALTAVDAKADQNAADIADINTELTEINNTLGDCATNDALGELENIVTLKANKSALEAEETRATAKEGELETAIGTKAASVDLTAEISRAQSAEEELADRVDALEEIRVLDCGTY